MTRHPNELYQDLLERAELIVAAIRQVDGDRVADEANGNLVLTIQRHKPRYDGELSLVTWAYCSCEEYVPFRANDGNWSIGPATYPCSTVQRLANRLGIDWRASSAPAEPPTSGERATRGASSASTSESATEDYGDDDRPPAVG